MRQSTPLSRAAVFALELLIVTLSVRAGAELAMRFRIVPRSLMHLPVVSFSTQDVLTVLKADLIGCALTFAGARLIAGWNVFTAARRVAIEVYALVTGIVAAALYMFFLTAVNFSPELLLQSTLIAIALFLMVFLLFAPPRLGVGERIGQFFADMFGLLKRPAAIAVLIFALTPIIVGEQFIKNRNFANWVTRLRINANVTTDRPFVFVNALGATRFKTPIMVQFARSDPATAYVLTRQGELWRVDYPSGTNARLLMNIAQKVGYVEMENGGARLRSPSRIRKSRIEERRLRLCLLYRIS